MRVSQQRRAGAGAGRFDFDQSLLGDKSWSVVFDNSKLKAIAPGFKPRISFEEGVKRTVDYVLTHPDCRQEEPEFDAWCDAVVAALEAAKKACR